MTRLEVPNLSLAGLAQELQPLIVNAFVSKVQWIGENSFKLKLSTVEGNKDLLITPAALFWTEYRVPSIDEQQNFVLKLRKHIQGKKILAIKQHHFDRIILLQFSECVLVLELFAHANVVLVDQNQITLSCLRREEWKDRITQAGKPYRFPAAKPIPTEIPFSVFKQKLSLHTKRIVPALLINFNLFPALAEESVLAQNISLDQVANQLSEENCRAIYGCLLEFFQRASFQPTLAHQTPEEKLLLPFPLPNWSKHHAIQTESCPSFSLFLDQFLSKVAGSTTQRESHAKEDQHIKKLEHALEQQKQAVEKFQRLVVENHLAGEWIYIHYADLIKIKEETEKIQSTSSAEIVRQIQEKHLSIPVAQQLMDYDPRRKRAHFEKT